MKRKKKKSWGKKVASLVICFQQCRVPGAALSRSIEIRVSWGSINKMKGGQIGNKWGTNVVGNKQGASKGVNRRRL